LSKHVHHDSRRTQQQRKLQSTAGDRRAAPRVPLSIPPTLPPAGPTRVAATRVRTLPLAPTYEEWVRVVHPEGARVKPRPTRPDRPRGPREPALERPTLGKGAAR